MWIIHSLTQTATWEEIGQICDDAMEYETVSSLYPQVTSGRRKNMRKDKMEVCTVIGFPNGIFLHYSSQKSLRQKTPSRRGFWKLICNHIG